MGNVLLGRSDSIDGKQWSDESGKFPCLYTDNHMVRVWVTNDYYMVRQEM